MPRMSNRRKLAIASWRAPREGNIYGKLTLDATQALAYLEHVRTTTGERATITHLVGKVAAIALGEERSLNGRILMGKYRPHDTVDIAFLVAFEEGADLAQAKIEHADQKSTADIARELREKAERLRARADKDFNKGQGLVKLLPTWLIRPLLWFTGWLTASVGLPAFGQKKFPFGSCIITSVGMFGLDEGFAPPTPFARVPIYVLVGAVREQPTVVDGKVVVRPMLTVTATIDHRFIDGYQGGVLARAFRRTFDNPWQLDGLAGPPVPARRRAAKVAGARPPS